MKKPVVLILCTGNSCRSQMAEGFLRKFQGDKYDVQSAGTAPAERVHPMAIRVMAEVEIDISGAQPKDTRVYLGHWPIKHLLIVCDKANGTCPRIWPGTISRTYHPFEDPAHFVGTEDETLEKFREVRDQIAAAMMDWEPQTEFVKSTVKT